MQIELRMSFDSLTELKTFLDSKVEAPKTCSCQNLTPSVPEPVPVEVPPVTTVPAPEVPQPVEVQQTLPLPEATAPTVEEPAPTTTQPEPTVEAAPTQAVSTAAASYTLDDLARAGSELVDLGKQAELPGILAKFGIASLPELPQAQYADFALVLREMGAHI